MSAALTPIRVEVAFWLILSLGLAAGIGIETDRDRQSWSSLTPVPETPPKFAKPMLAERFRLPPPDQLTNITLRPIFVPTRRPAPIAPLSDSSKPSMKKDQFILMGITIVGGGKFAFLLEKAGNRNRVVGEGKRINGIMVKEVTTERVVLSQYDDTEVLALKSIRPPPGTQGDLPAVPGVTPHPQAPKASNIGPR